MTGIEITLITGAIAIILLVVYCVGNLKGLDEGLNHSFDLYMKHICDDRRAYQKLIDDMGNRHDASTDKIISDCKRTVLNIVRECKKREVSRWSQYLKH